MHGCPRTYTHSVIKVRKQNQQKEKDDLYHSHQMLFAPWLCPSTQPYLLFRGSSHPQTLPHGSCVTSLEMWSVSHLGPGMGYCLKGPLWLLVTNP